MVYSASSARNLLESQGDGTSYLVKYVIHGALGLGLMFWLSKFKLERVRKLTPILLAISMVLLLVVLVPGVGVVANGARRWLALGPLQFQPSELMKIALILHCAAVFASRPKISKDVRLIVAPILGVAGLAILLIAAESDLGTALVISMTLMAMLIAVGLPIKQLGTLVGGGAVLVLLFSVIEPYRLARLKSFFDPWADPTDTGFQSVQGLIAIGSGGFFGVGPGQSVQKIFYLPEAQTDFILAVIGEELGVVGILGLMLLYGIIAYAGLRTAKAAKGIYAKLLAAGITSLILCQALLNTYTVLGLAPLTGVPLPFISAGSTSLLVLLGGVGLLLNIASGGSAHLQSVGSSGTDSDDRTQNAKGRKASEPPGNTVRQTQPKRRAAKR
jgi:cell division protein FtsW